MNITPIKSAGFVVPVSAQSAILLLDQEQQKRIFKILVIAIYKKIPKEDRYSITFVNKGNGLISMCANGKHIFYFYRCSTEEMSFIQRIVKILASQKTEYQVQTKAMDFANFVEKNLGTMLGELFAHYSMNHLFPWTIDFQRVCCKSYHCVLESENQKDVVEIVRITKAFVEEKTNINDPYLEFSGCTPVGKEKNLN